MSINLQLTLEDEKELIRRIEKERNNSMKDMFNRMILERENIITTLKNCEEDYNMMNENISQLTKKMRDFEDSKRHFDACIAFLEKYIASGN